MTYHILSYLILSYYLILSSKYFNNNKLTNKFPGAALHVKGIVAELAVGVGGLEEQTVRTELGLRHVGHTLVVLVALLRVGEEPVRLGALELGRFFKKERKKNINCFHHSNKIFEAVHCNSKSFEPKAERFFAFAIPKQVVIPVIFCLYISESKINYSLLYTNYSNLVLFSLLLQDINKRRSICRLSLNITGFFCKKNVAI